jgi:dihydrofolate reductase
MSISMILAVANNGVIGNNNTLVWKQKKDMQLFKSLTSGNAIIMGRKTFDSIKKPLPNRTNIVITRNINFEADGVLVFNNLNMAIQKAKETNKEIFIIGGADIYTQSIPLVDKIYLTKIDASPEGDAYFNFDLLEKFNKTSTISLKKDEENEFDYSFEEYIKRDI